jgi:hypothetical protein
MILLRVLASSRGNRRAHGYHFDETQSRTARETHRQNEDHGASRGSAQALSSQHFREIGWRPLFGAAFCICRMPVI